MVDYIIRMKFNHSEKIWITDDLGIRNSLFNNILHVLNSNLNRDVTIRIHYNSRRIFKMDIGAGSNRNPFTAFINRRIGK